MAKLKLTPERQTTICDLVRAGNDLSVAAACAGISRSTLFGWLRHGEAEESGVYRDFTDALRQAEAEAEAEMLTRIRTAALDTWQAAAWYLERRHPDRWGRRARLDVRHSLEDEARRWAQENGLDEHEALAEVEALLTRQGLGRREPGAGQQRGGA